MNSKLLASAIVFAIAFGTPDMGFALERASQNALTFFKRYESEITNNYRRLEECSRKLAVTDGSKADDLLIEAEEIMDRIQKRYDLLDDQYSFTASTYPADRNALRDGFAPIEDKYREIRNFYTDNFKNRGKAKKEAVSKEPAKKSVTAPANSAVSSGTSPKLDDASYQEALAALRRPATNKAEEQKLAKEAAAKKAAEEKAAKEAAKQEALKIAEEQKAAKEAAKQAAREAAAQRVAEEKAAKEAAKQEALKIAEEKKAAKEAAKQAAREAAAQRAAEEKAAREAAKAAKQTASVAPVSMPSPAVESDSYQEALAALKRPSSKSAKKQDKKAEQPKQTVISEKNLEALAKAKAKEEAIREVKENAKSGVSNDFLKSLAAVKKNSGIKGNPEVASIKPRKSAKELEAERQAQIEAEKMAQLAMELKTRAEEEKAKLEAKQAMEEQAKARAEAQAKAKAEALAKLEAEKKAKEEAEKKAREKAEIIAQIKAEALQKAKAAEEAREREKAEAIARAVAEKEAEMRAKVEAERKAQEEALARIEAEKRAQEEAEKRAQEKARAAALAELKAREEAEKKAKEEARAQLLAEMKAKAEAEAERKAREEAERIAKAEAEKRAKERARAAVLAEMKAKEEAEKKAKEELEKKAFEEARAQLLAEKKSREAKFAAQTAPALTKAEIRKQTLAEIAAEQALEEKDAVKAAVVTTNAFAAAVNNAARATGSAIDTTSASYAEALSALKRDPKKIAEEKKQARAQAKLEAEQKAQAKAEVEQKAKEEALAKAQAKIDAERIAKAEETAKAQAREEALAKAKAAEEARKQAIEEAKVLAAKKAAEDTLMDIPAFRQQLEDDKAADMADVLKAIEIKQAIEAEKIRAARKAKELAEAEKARKAADEALKQAEREAERIARRAARAANEDEDKLKLTGVVSVEIKNREEKYKAQNVVGRPNGESKLPNDMNQFKLSLAYQSSENHLFTLDERYVQRERNEVVKENYLDISYWTKQNNARAWKVANSFQTTEYPDTDSKDYRDNKFEVSMERTAENREGVTTLGYQVRSYPNYERADYNQISVKDTENFIRTDGSLYGEGRIDTRKYSNYSDLDYNNQNLYLEYTKIFENNSELTIADTYDRRNYDKEAPRLYRSSYFDNYFRLNYLMPTDGIFTYEVEVQHTKHDYDSDKDRGYAETNLWFASKMKLTKKTRAQLDFRYIDNDENSRILAHKNNEIHFMVQKNVNDMFRVRFDHTYHNRDSVVGNSMNFDEHTSEAKLSWIMEKNFDVAWKVGYNSRIYDTTQHEDYRTYSTGLDVRYEKRNQYEWRLTPYVRKIEFRNFYKEGMPEPVKNWEDEIQPCIEFEYVKPLKEDLRFTFNASYEKTYYKTYDAGMQDLIWNFAKPMEITQFVGKLEQSF